MRFFVLLTVFVACTACSIVDRDGSDKRVPDNSAKAVGQDDSHKPAKANIAAYKTCLSKIAARMDKTVEDGWLFAQEPRIFKSPYAQTPPEQKADFALAYHDFLESCHQDLVRDYKTYVPYSKRQDFALLWWGSKASLFNKSENKMQVLWAHEAMEDASELWWRAGEKLEAEPADSIKLMAHEEEQRLVFNYSEAQGAPGSFSGQVYKREHNH